MKTFTLCLTSEEVSVVNRILSVEGLGTIEITGMVDCYRLTDVMTLSIIRFLYINSFLLDKRELTCSLAFCEQATVAICSTSCVEESDKLIFKKA